VIRQITAQKLSKKASLGWGAGLGFGMFPLLVYFCFFRAWKMHSAKSRRLFFTPVVQNMRCKKHGVVKYNVTEGLIYQVRILLLQFIRCFSHVL
jgi:hypothetical protein